MASVKDESAIVTGSAKRVGREIALALAGKGYNIGLHYRGSKDEASRLKEQIEDLGVECVLLGFDLSDPASAAELFRQAVQGLPRIRVLINNASTFQQSGLLQTSLALFEHNFALHVRAPFFLTSEFARVCGEGHVINIVDMMVAQINVDYFAYLLSKKTLLEFTYMAAAALGPKIRVNAIAPGSVEQPIDESDPDYLNKRAKQIPLKMPGNAKYVVQGIEYLLANPFVTGDCLFVDGGAHLPLFFNPDPAK